MKIKNVAIAFVLILLCVAAFAQNKKELKDVVLNDLIEETRVNLRGSSGIQLVWWIPTEFWRAIYAQDESIVETAAQSIVDAMDAYTVVLVVDGEMVSLGTFTSKNGKILDTYKKGGNVQYGETKLNYDLPLSPLLEDKKCPKDQELMDAKWNYCSIYGIKQD